MRKQNLNLFFVANQSEQSINNSLTQNYMNRLTIEEDFQTEVNGVFYFYNRQPVKVLMTFKIISL